MFGEAGSLFLSVFINPFPTENTQSITNGLDPLVGPVAPGQQMPERMRPSRQEPGDSDAGEVSSSGFTPLFSLFSVIDWVL